MLDALCCHAQQAAEKAIKALLLHRGVSFPFTHNLSKLVDICAEVDPSFQTLLDTVEPLTPYAVELRYDSDFWPSEQLAREARSAALAVREAVLERMPAYLADA